MFWLSHQYPICIPLLPHSCYMPRPSYPSLLDYSNYTWRRVQVMKFLIMQFSITIIHMLLCITFIITSYHCIYMYMYVSASLSFLPLISFLYILMLYIPTFYHCCLFLHPAVFMTSISLTIFQKLLYVTSSLCTPSHGSSFLLATSQPNYLVIIPSTLHFSIKIYSFLCIIPLLLSPVYNSLKA
jgi:hypothetical protein